MEKKQHPSYGMIRFARSSIGGSGTALFGSSIMHNNVIRLSISKGMMEREGNEDWFLAGTDINDMIVEVEMSYTQFAEAITSLNMGYTSVSYQTVPKKKIPLYPQLAGHDFVTGCVDVAKIYEEVKSERLEQEKGMQMNM